MSSENAPQNAISKDSMFFPPMRQLLKQNPDLFHNLTLECQVCRTCPLAIVGDGRAEQDRGSNGLDKNYLQAGDDLEKIRPAEDGEMAIVLPCGHIFCKSCVFQIRYQGFIGPLAMHDVSDPCCPVCRFKLRYEECWASCRHSGIPFPKSAEALAKFPQTTTEAASGTMAMPKSCNTCLITRKRANVQSTMRQLVEGARAPGGQGVLQGSDVVVSISTTNTGIEGSILDGATKPWLEAVSRLLRSDMDSNPWGGAPPNPGLQLIARWMVDVVAEYQAASARSEDTVMYEEMLFGMLEFTEGWV